MVRDALRKGLKKLLGVEEPTPWTAPPEPLRPARAPEPAPAPATTPAAAAPEEPAPVRQSPFAGGAASVAPAAAQVREAVSPVPTDDVAGPPLTVEAVQQVLDEMVRPALQGDGGDISLVAVDGHDIHVRLVGACSTCPSSIMTMKMGVEALLREEFPQMRELVQVS